jgi:hypothetical protein
MTLLVYISCAAVIGCALLSPAAAMVALMLMLLIELVLQGSFQVFRSVPALANLLIAGIAAFSATMLVARTNRPLAGYFNRVSVPVFVIFAWSWISLLWTPAESLPAGRDTSATGSYIIIEALPYFFVYVLMAPVLIRTLTDWERVCRFMLWLGPLVALAIVLNPEFAIKQGRLGTSIDGSLRTSPLAMSQAGGMIAIFGALSHSGSGNRLALLARIASFGAGTAVVLLSGTRGQAIFEFVAIIAAIPVAKPLKSLKAFVSIGVGALVMALGVFWLFDFALSQTDSDRWTANAIASGTAVRLANIEELVRAFLSSPTAPIIGLGSNAFSAISGSVGEGYSHNLFIDLLCEQGLPMLFLFVFACFNAFQSGRGLMQYNSADLSKRSALGILLAMELFSLLIAGKEGNLWSSWNVFLFLMIAARIGSVDLASCEESPHPNPLSTSA